MKTVAPKEPNKTYWFEKYQQQQQKKRRKKSVRRL